MDVVVKWSREATRQLRELTEPQRQGAKQLAVQLEQNIYIGNPSFTRPLPGGGEERVYAVYGLYVELRYRFKGWIVKRLEIEVIGVAPSPLRSQDEHEDYMRNRRPPYRGRGGQPPDDEDDIRYH